MIVACGVSFGQQAEQPTAKQALIKELWDLVGGREAVTAMTKSLMDQQQAEIPKILMAAIESDSSLTAAQKQDIRKSVGESVERVSKHVSQIFEKIDVGGMLEDVNRSMYDKHFTEAELQD